MTALGSPRGGDLTSHPSYEVRKCCASALMAISAALSPQELFAHGQRRRGVRRVRPSSPLTGVCGGHPPVHPSKRRGALALNVTTAQRFLPLRLQAVGWVGSVARCREVPENSSSHPPSERAHGEDDLTGARSGADLFPHRDRLPRLRDSPPGGMESASFDVQGGVWDSHLHSLPILRPARPRREFVHVRRHWRQGPI